MIHCAATLAPPEPLAAETCACAVRMALCTHVCCMHGPWPTPGHVLDAQGSGSGV